RARCCIGGNRSQRSDLVPIVWNSIRCRARPPDILFHCLQEQESPQSISTTQASRKGETIAYALQKSRGSGTIENGLSDSVMVLSSQNSLSFHLAIAL